MRNFNSLLLLAMFLLPSLSMFSQNHWKEINIDALVQNRSSESTDMPKEYKTLSLDQKSMQDILWTAAPIEDFAAPVTIVVPNPEGEYEYFDVWEEQIFSDELAAEYSETIKTFSGLKVGQSEVTIRLSLSPIGFYATIFEPHNSYMVEPISNMDELYYMSYFKRDYISSPIQCMAKEHQANYPTGQAENPTFLRQYKLVYVPTGEFSQQFGVVPPGSGGNPTIANVQASIATSVNIANGVYKRDVGVRFSNSTPNSLIFLDPNTDPYDPNNSNAMLTVNQTQVDNAVGNANYDIGHVIAFGNFGGVAVAATCETGFKAQGYSSGDTPLQQITIDYFCHEAGHQLGANHTFSAQSCGTSVNGNRYEPGEGTSIMAYAGVCDQQDRIQSQSDPFFSWPSIVEMHNFIQNTATCHTTAANSGNPEDPTPSTCATLTIPKNTPFVLKGSATDATDQANLTYNWQQFDSAPNPTTGFPNCMSTTDPMFRFLPASASGHTRIFPSTAPQGNNASDWEKLPCVARTMNFKMSVRDNNTNWGRTAAGSTVVTVANEGPFAVTAPNGGENINNTTTVTWTGASTTICATVDILLSTDGGMTYPTNLANGTPNDNSQMVTIPGGTNSTTARIIVQCHVNSGNAFDGCTFFDASDANFTAMSNATPPCSVSAISVSNISACNDNGTPSISTDDTFTADVTVTFANAPSTGTLDLTGDGTGSVAVGSLNSATSHKFTGVTMSADGGAINLTAAFSSDSGCTFTNANAGTAPASCSTPPAPCSVSAISTSNISACNDNGTPTDPSDDTFTADVTVTFANAPSTGTLDLTGDGTGSVAVGSLNSATSHKFTGVTMSADGGAINLTAAFSANAGCTFTNANAGTAPASCSDPCAGNTVHVGNVFLLNQNAVNNFSSCITKIEGQLWIQGFLVTDLSPLGNLEEVTGNVTIRNSSLTDLTGLEKLKDIGGALQVMYNNNLANIAALDALTKINSYLYVWFNQKLTSLTGLENVSNVAGNLIILGNATLSDCCAVEPIIPSGVGGVTIVAGNATGCENIGAIQNACSAQPLIVPLDDNTKMQNIFGRQLINAQIFPNPVDSEMNLVIEEEFEEGNLQIIDKFGRVVFEKILGQNEQINSINTEFLPEGMYYMQIQLEKGQVSKPFFKSSMR
jgi:hypothetical protein